MFTDKIISCIKMETYSIEILYIAFMLMFLYLIFMKAGEKGWKAFIPIYSDYIIFKIAGYKESFIPCLALVVGSFIPPIIYNGFNMANNIVGGIFASLNVIMLAIALIIVIFVLISLFERFGHSSLFLIGFLVFPLIFLGILALDNSKYEQKEEKTKNKNKKKKKK